MTQLPDTTDVLIIGGGPSGSAAAACLLAQGIETCIVEREAAEDEEVVRR